MVPTLLHKIYYNLITKLLEYIIHFLFCDRNLELKET